MSDLKKTIIGRIPDDWKIKKIKDVCDTTSGGTPSRSKLEYYESGTIPWIKTGELNQKYIFDTEEKITEIAIQQSSAKLIPKNSVLIAMYGATIGKTSITKIEAATNQACCAMISKGEIEPEFLYYVLSYSKDKIISLGAGGAQPNISQQIIRELEIPFPLQGEQRKIAAILSAVDEVIEKTEAIIEQTEKVKKGLMQQLLTKGIGHTIFKKTEIGEIPEEWELKKVEEVFYEVRDTSNNLELYPLYSLTIEEGLVPKPDRYERSFLLKNKEENQYRLVYPQNILFNPMNLRFGAIAISKEKVPVSVSAYYNVLSTVNDNYLAEYYAYLFCSGLYISLYERIATGSLIEKKRVHLSQFFKISVPVPPKDEQKKIVEIISSIENKIQNEKQRLNQLQMTKKGLMQVLLTGKVRVKVDDEVMSQ
ncbi:MAG TPA: restriction endonuclease subunit S [Anoxybacillus sp.]|nr:restriction endonuclease subunit S [Anoxybacillus sp.]